MELDHQETGPGEDYDKHAAAKGGGEGMRRSHARQEGERDRWKARREQGTVSVCIYAMVILLTFHEQYCFTAAVTDRDEVRGGKDLSVARAAGQAVALSQMSPHQHAVSVPASHT